MKKVVMVVNNSFTNDSRVLREAASLVNNGFDVTVYATRKTGTPTAESINGVKVKRVASRYDFRLKPWRYFTELLPAKDELIKEQADIYHAHDLDTLLITYQAAKKVKAKIIYDSHELFTERYFKKGFPVVSNIKASAYKAYVKILEIKLIGKVDWVLTVNESIAKELKKRYKINNITVILNSQPKLEKKVVGKKNLRKILNLYDNERIVIYQG